MDNDKSHVHGGGIPSPSGWSTGFSQTNDSYNDNSEQPSSTLPLLIPAPNFVPEPSILGEGGGETDSSHFGPDISQMLDYPFRNLGHRRAHSEILTGPENGINFDDDLGVLGSGYEPFFSDENEEPDLYGIDMDMVRLNSSSAMPTMFQLGEPPAAAAAVLPPPLPPPSAVATPLAAATGPAMGLGAGSAEGFNPEMLASSSEGPSGVERKKALSAAKLAELALVDPRSAKRQSAARSKERKLRYIAELEGKVQTLQTQVTTLSSQLTFLQRDINCLKTENHELKYRLQTMEQQVQSQDALNDALKDEIEHLKVLAGLVMHNSDPCPLISAQPLHQLQIQLSEPQHPFEVQHHQLPQLQQPTGDFSFRGRVHLAIQGDYLAADNSSM